MLALMATAGWYPDPAGSGGYRHWDGNTWSQDTSPDPNRPPPTNSSHQRRRRGAESRSGLWTSVIVGVALIVAVAIILALLLGGGRGGPGPIKPVDPDTNSASPTVKGWEETSPPSAPPTIGELVDCPRTTDRSRTRQLSDGRMRGGGLSFERVPGWRSDSMHLQWISDLNTQMDSVRPGWVSNVGVGQLNTVDGFTDLRTSAHQTMECFASSGYYEYFTKRVDLLDEPYTVSGHSAWRLRADIHIKSSRMPEIEGDVVDIVVVDIGDPNRFGIWVSSITIGDTRRQQLHDKALASLRVE